MKKQKAYMNWSGGKDAAYGYYLMQKSSAISIDTLFTGISAHGRVSLHGVHVDLLYAQAQSLNKPLVLVETPLECSMQEYKAIMSSAVAKLVEQGYTDTVFGDIALEDLKEYRESMLRSLGVRAHFPLWGESTLEQGYRFIQSGFKAVVVSVNGTLMDSSFAGRLYNKEFLENLPKGVDPCGENGEFHTFVFDGPIFQYPIDWEMGEVVEKRYPATETHPNGSIFYFREIRQRSGLAELVE